LRIRSPPLVVLLTVTDTAELEPTLPAASYARVWSEWLPSATVVVLHENEYGELVSLEWSEPSR
jgi:hypothetical protein